MACKIKLTLTLTRELDVALEELIVVRKRELENGRSRFDFMGQPKKPLPLKWQKRMDRTIRNLKSVREVVVKERGREEWAAAARANERHRKKTAGGQV